MQSDIKALGLKELEHHNRIDFIETPNSSQAAKHPKSGGQ